ncbi:hypothetical protein PtA15_17A130 [Puccinia triticina]|uniref:Uncharacterized protein n=1 Tax=Puccinia triticina TaxID=208348 RepID=A0ABY7D4V4_9BASI|nr:uncharacterized protein PtA15_17A130 [Puccinia triticina]WAQ92648.1 hypothetical protein PtA15_17A130 [Puccinia triticina]WAR63539.1 hypothetical protein PtB15_17B139 [Puccinia triticina]
MFNYHSSFPTIVQTPAQADSGASPAPLGPTTTNNCSQAVTPPRSSAYGQA